MNDKAGSASPSLPRVERRLAAILHADVQGYSRLIHEDEIGTLQLLTPALELLRTFVQQHGGQAVGSRGDSLLAEFPSVVEAVQCAVEMQRELRARNAALPEPKPIAFRMGISLGDIVIDGDQPHGDGINIAVRIEALAEPGGICISDVVYHQVKHKLPLTYGDLGEQHLKNIPEPVRVWRIVMEEADSPQSTVPSPQSQKGRQKPRRVSMSVFVFVLLFGGITVVRYFSRPVPSLQSLASSPQSPTPSTQPLPLPDKPSIVVLPFTNMSGDPEQEYFSDGITEDITATLSQLSGFFVIARNSAFTYKGKAVKVQDISREMGVRYVLEGSVRKAGEQVRVTAQLIDGPSGGHVWSERYDRPLTDIFAVQDEIVQRLVTTLRVEVQDAELERVRRIPTTNLTAYDSLLRAEEYLHRVTREDNAKARQLCEHAIALDPQYAAAHTCLSLTYWEESHWSPNPQHLERALGLAQQAIALNDFLPMAHSLVSLVYGRKQHYDRAIVEGERAVVLDPNNAYSAAWLAEVLNFAGRPAEAIGWAEKAMRLDPRYPYWFAFQLAIAYRLTGRYAEAITAQQQALLHHPNAYSYAELASIYVQQWAYQLSQDPQTLGQALAAAQRAVALNDSFWSTHLALGHVHLAQRQYEQAVAEMERAAALDPFSSISHAALADALSRVGRTDDALRAVEQAIRRRSIVADTHLLFVGIAYAFAGRHEEALASLKHYLTRYPNILGAHLTLAAIYSELGKEAEAQAEAAEVLRINPKFSLEVHKERVPIKDPATLERQLAALRKAGLK